jgi:integrase
MDPEGEHILSFRQAQADALVWFREIDGHDAGGDGDKNRGPYTVTRAMNDYLDWIRDNRGQKTYIDTKCRIDNFILPALGAIELRKLKYQRLDKWFRNLANMPPRVKAAKGATEPKFRMIDDNDGEARRKRKSTANRTLTVLKAALNKAWREGKTETEAAWRPIEAFENVDAARLRYLTVDEAKRLINGASPDFRLMIQAGLLTGARYGDLAKLQVQDFDANNNSLYIRQNKTGKAHHVILDEQGAKFFIAVSAGKSRSDLMLPRADGGKWNDTQQQRRMKSASMRAGLSEPATFYSLRHTYASLAVMNGMPLLIVAANLGHTSLRMVEKHYAHLAPSYIKKTVQETAPQFGIKHATNVATIDGKHHKN